MSCTASMAFIALVTAVVIFPVGFICGFSLLYWHGKEALKRQRAKEAAP